MAAHENTQFVHSTVSPLSLPFHDRNVLWPAKTSRAIPSLTSSQKARRPAASSSRAGCQAEGKGNAAARAECSKPISAHSDDESDDDLPSLEELFRTTPLPNASTETSKIENTLEHHKHPAPNAGILVDQTKSGLGERQGDSPDQPVILDDDESDEEDIEDEAEGASGDVETRCIERDQSLYNSLATPELASGSTESIDASDPWFRIKEGCFVEEPASRLSSCEQQDVPSAPAQDQHDTLLRSSQPLQDQISQQDGGSITRSMSVESASHSLLQISNDDDDSMTELENELELAFLQQVRLFSAKSPRLSSVEALPDESQSREHTETTGSRPEKPQDASPNSTVQGLEEWEQRETEVVVVEGGGVAMQQEELGQLAVGDPQDLVQIVDADEIEDQEATEALPTTQPEIPKIDEHRFRLRGIRTQPLAGRQTKTKEYRIVWGDRLNRSDSWFNEEDIRISVLQPPCERPSQDMILPVEMDITRVHRMRIDKRSKGKKTFEYLVNEPRTWISDDQLTISLNPMLVTDLEGSSPYPLSETQLDVLSRHSGTPISTSQAFRNSSTLAGKPATLKRGHQEMYTKINNEPDYSFPPEAIANDTGGEDLQSSKRQRLSAPLGATVLNRLAKRSRRAVSLIPEDKNASSAAAFKSACSAESQLAALMIHNNDDWEVRKIIGKKDIEGVLYYRVVWAETWQPAHSLLHAKELVDEFETRMQEHRGVKRLGSQQGEQPVTTVDISSGQQQKRPRGRPRKQT